jgi:SAM-dependent methyltransferase
MSCPICADTASWPIRHQRDEQVDSWRAEFGDRAAYEWRLCRRCGNAYPSRQPDRRVLRRFWEIYRAVDDPDARTPEQVWNYRRHISRVGAQRSYQLFAPLAGSSGRFFDIACGLGETVRLFAQHGWQAEGIDADPMMAKIHQELGIQARIGQFEDIDIEGDYRIIHIAHAIYFITDPLAFMRKVRGRLAPDGLFCVVLADFMASADPSLPAYAHSFWPTASSMRFALVQAGFAPVFSRTLAGSIYLAARPAPAPPKPAVWPAAIRLGHQSKRLRYVAIGRPYLAVRRWAKTLLGRA